MTASDRIFHILHCKKDKSLLIKIGLNTWHLSQYRELFFPGHISPSISVSKSLFLSFLFKENGVLYLNLSQRNFINSKFLHMKLLFSSFLYR